MIKISSYVMSSQGSLQIKKMKEMIQGQERYINQSSKIII
jgi:hypothetical protein